VHPIIAAELARQLVDERVRTARVHREAVQGANATKPVTPQRTLVRESLLRLKRREERA
jgi:hypothetical protein